MFAIQDKRQLSLKCFHTSSNAPQLGLYSWILITSPTLPADTCVHSQRLAKCWRQTLPGQIQEFPAPHPEMTYYPSSLEASPASSASSPSCWNLARKLQKQTLLSSIATLTPPVLTVFLPSSLVIGVWMATDALMIQQKIAAMISWWLGLIGLDPVSVLVPASVPDLFLISPKLQRSSYLLEWRSHFEFKLIM